MNLDKSEISIANLLDFMHSEEPQEIQLNHVLIGDNFLDTPGNLALERLPYFTVQFGGFVEVEFHLNMTQDEVFLILVRQSAMTFEELEENGDVLPSLTIDCRALESSEHDRLNELAKRYVAAGKMTDKARGEALLTQYLEKAMFCSRKYGGMSNA